MSDFYDDFDFQKKYADRIKRMLCLVVGKMINVRVATQKEDTKLSTDYVIEVEMVGTVAARVRRKTIYRDLTIRSHRASGAETELSKIRRGFARWYLYIWDDGDGRVDEWIVVDLDKLRASGLLEKDRPAKINRDGSTGFVSFSFDELKAVGAILHHAKRSAEQNTHAPILSRP